MNPPVECMNRLEVQILFFILFVHTSCLDGEKMERFVSYVWFHLLHS